LVLGKCFKSKGLDNQTANEKEGGKSGSKQLGKGLVPKCLEKDCNAFRTLHKTKGKTKEQRLDMLSECRPEGCKSAVDLFLWLLEVILPFFVRRIRREGVLTL
jgi:hypothetical protein